MSANNFLCLPTSGIYINMARVDYVRFVNDFSKAVERQVPDDAFSAFLYGDNIPGQKFIGEDAKAIERYVTAE